MRVGQRTGLVLLATLVLLLPPAVVYYWVLLGAPLLPGAFAPHTLTPFMLLADPVRFLGLMLGPGLLALACCAYQQISLPLLVWIKPRLRVA